MLSNRLNNPTRVQTSWKQGKKHNSPWLELLPANPEPPSSSPGRSSPLHLVQIKSPEPGLIHHYHRLTYSNATGGCLRRLAACCVQRAARAWICAGSLLDLCWISAGSLLDLCWISAGSVLDLCWICAGSLLDLCFTGLVEKQLKQQHVVLTYKTVLSRHSLASCYELRLLLKFNNQLKTLCANC